MRKLCIGSALAVLLFAGCRPGDEPSEPSRSSVPGPPVDRVPAATPDAEVDVASSPLHGRVEEHGGLRVLRLWGTPEQRGYAHGKLLGPEIADLLRAEYEYRFERRQPALEMGRKSLGRLITFPEDYRREIEAMYRGLVHSGADLAMPSFDRDLDRDDLLLVNAMDMIALMGCSGFTAWDDQVEGGGVLTGRNFDWPYTGPHMADNVILVVQHADGRGAVASVAWPGFVGSVTAVNHDGTAAFLHVGNAKFDPTPETDSYPTAVAARRILEQVGDGSQGLGIAEEMLDYTSPAVGFITRLVRPDAVGTDSPAVVYEVDANSVSQVAVEGPTVITNHFQWRSDARDPSGDSRDRMRAVRRRLDECLAAGDRKLSPAEGWELLTRVERGGKTFFGTLHSLVYRAEPWYFELRVASWDEERGLVPATSSGRRFVLDREHLFPPRASFRGR